MFCREGILRLLSYFTKFKKCDQSFMCHWLPSDSGYYSSAHLLPFENNVVFSKSSWTLHNETFAMAKNRVKPP